MIKRDHSPLKLCIDIRFPLYPWQGISFHNLIPSNGETRLSRFMYTMVKTIITVIFQKTSYLLDESNQRCLVKRTGGWGSKAQYIPDGALLLLFILQQKYTCSCYVLPIEVKYFRNKTTPCSYLI